jgi:hypothetical protein
MSAADPVGVSYDSPLLWFTRRSSPDVTFWTALNLYRIRGVVEGNCMLSVVWGDWGKPFSITVSFACFLAEYRTWDPGKYEAIVAYTLLRRSEGFVSICRCHPFTMTVVVPWKKEQKWMHYVCRLSVGHDRQLLKATELWCAIQHIKVCLMACSTLWWIRRKDVGG